MAWGLRGRVTLAGALLFDGDLWLEPGFTCVMGPSGVGKSTLLRLLAGLSGVADLDGRVERPASIGWMAQDLALQPRLSVGQNVDLMQRLAGQPGDTARVAALLASVGLEGFAPRRIDTLSGGQRARVALARVLMQDASLVLLDEPFGALDPENRRKMQDLAQDRLQGRTVLMVTHDPIEALRLAHRLLVLGAGQLTGVALPAIPPPRDIAEGQTLATLARLLATGGAA